MASRGRVEAREDKRRSLNAFCVASPAPSDLADACSQSQTLERFQRETPVGVAVSLQALRCDSQNKALLCPLNVNSGEFCGPGEEKTAPRGELLRAGPRGLCERRWLCRNHTHRAHPPGPVWGAAFGWVSTGAGGLRALCWTGTSQHVVTVLNCWFSKQCSNPKACSPGALTMTVYPHGLRRFFQMPRLQ